MVFTGAIQAWGRSKDVRKAAKALQLLQRMRKLDNNENTSRQQRLTAHNTAIDACSRTTMRDITTGQQLAALKIAFAVFKVIEKEELTANYVPILQY